MDLSKIKHYVNLAEISVLMVLTFYLFPLSLLIGSSQSTVFIGILSIVLWFFAWKTNNTLHELLDKWEIKKQK